jgi:triacylglycerol lipase
VLAHGLGGDKPFLKCFMGIPEDLKPLGVPVYTPKVARYGTVFARAETLKEQIMQVLEETRAPKVNIIGHSMGGLDARYLAWVSGLWLSTTIAHTTHTHTQHDTTHTAHTGTSSPTLEATK